MINHLMVWPPNVTIWIFQVIEGIYRICIVEPQRGLSLLYKVLEVAGGYILVGIAFILFVVVNGGIVVGDRSAHVATFHPIQILYFIAFTTVFTAPYIVSQSKLVGFWKCIRKHWMIFSVCCLVIASIVDSYGSLAHKFLLADNR